MARSPSPEHLSEFLGTADWELQNNFQRQAQGKQPYESSGTWNSPEECDRVTEALWSSPKFSASSSGGGDGGSSMVSRGGSGSSSRLGSTGLMLLSAGGLGPLGNESSPSPGTPGHWRALTTPPVPPTDIGEKFGEMILKQVGHKIGFKGRGQAFIPVVDYPGDVRPSFGRRRRATEAAEITALFRKHSKTKGRAAGNASATKARSAATLAAASSPPDVVTSSVSRRLYESRVRKKR